MRSSVPTIHCDGAGGMCNEWTVDEYAIGTSTVGGIRVTLAERSPGWLSTQTDDFCPKHKEGKS